MLKKSVIITWLLVTGIALSTQAQKFTISGQLRDQKNGEDLPFVNVVVKGSSPMIATTSNIYGFYSISLEAGDYTLQYSFIGYDLVEKPITLNDNQRVDLELAPTAEMIEEIVVTSETEDQNITSNEGSVTRLDMRDVKKLPTFGGEPDVVRVMQMNPGIKTAGEGNAGYYVRGGGLDQNLIWLDEAPVYNPSHLLGFFSVFNGDALKSATMYKGGMMPEYGGRTASVMDVRMKDGNSKKTEVSGGVGLIATRLTIESPIVKDKGSFMISGRRTYADLFLGLSNNEQFSESQLYFYDLNAKANYRINENNRVFLSGYFGRDKFGFQEDFGINWGNATGTFRWNHLFSDKLFSNTTLVRSNYDYEFGFGADEDRLAVQSVIKDINVKQDFTLFPNDKNVVKFGANLIHHTIEPGNLSAGENTGIISRQADLKYGLEGAAYIQNEQKISKRFHLNYGLRMSTFTQLGPGTSYEFDEAGNLLSETEFNNTENMKTYVGWEPRMAANYVINEQSSVKAGFNRNYQYLHLLSNATTSTPTDVWIMSSNNVKPQIANQVSLGYFRNFNDNTFETSAEVYYKGMSNTIDYRTGANVFFNEQLEGDLVYGTGQAYGLELMVRKRKGKLTGWVGYTLSRTLRQFDEINNGNKFPARQDRVHDLTIAAVYEITPKLSLSTNFIYYTGDAVTFPTGKYEIDGTTVPFYTERNGYRMPHYHRMDLGLTWYRKNTDKYESNWNFSCYNAYGRENAYSISFQESSSNPNQTEAVQLSLFKWIPSVTYNFKFK